MLYRIGEVAEILGVTKEGVRFLERKGLLHSVRAEHNGYRYYTRGELSTMQQIHSYSSAGFTLEEAADLVLREEEDLLLTALSEKEGELDEEIRALRRKQELLRLHRKAILGAFSRHEGRTVCNMPAMRYLPLEGEYAPPGGDGRLREAEKRWMAAVPQVMLAKLPMDRAGRPLESRGVCVDAREAERLGLPLEGSLLLPAGRCLVAYVCKPVGRVREFHALYGWACAQGWVPQGEMLAAVRLSVVRGGERCTISMVRMPVGKE